MLLWIPQNFIKKLLRRAKGALVIEAAAAAADIAEYCIRVHNDVSRVESFDFS